MRNARAEDGTDKQPPSPKTYPRRTDGLGSNLESRMQTASGVPGDDDLGFSKTNFRGTEETENAQTHSTCAFVRNLFPSLQILRANGT